MECTKNAGQQETNAALAALAASGNAFALGQLWEINQGLLRSMFWKWYPANKAVADAHGMTAEDFEQEGYFSVKYAAENYNPESGTFAGWLWQVVKWRMGLVLSNGHRRTVANKDGTRRTVSADPLNYCASLDAPATADDENSTTMGELLPDPAAAREMQSVEDRLYHEQMHNDLEAALQKLVPEEAAVLRYRFYEDKTLQEAAEVTGETVSTVRAIEGICGCAWPPKSQKPGNTSEGRQNHAHHRAQKPHRCKTVQGHRDIQAWHPKAAPPGAC